MNDWLKMLISFAIGIPVGCTLMWFLIKWFGVEAALMGIVGALLSEIIYRGIKE